MSINLHHIYFNTILTDFQVKSFIFILKLIIICSVQFLHAQNDISSFNNHSPQKTTYFASGISVSDSIGLANLPVLIIPDNLLKTTLPYHLDNSDQPYFRDLFVQESSECGQYTSIAFNFTYEINYRRNTPANIPENQYPTHFTYNFMNGGYGWHGVSYFHSYEIARTNGHPTVLDYGGISTGGPSRWLSGYEKYYRGMFNKLENVYQIEMSTPEGLLTLKQWLYDHGENGDAGGIASFYSSSPWNTKIFPPGSPEEGKHVITGFNGPAGHASTITGWNDSIRYDYNNDGLFTNDIDINEDGMVDMKDWEIGGLLFMDSYIGGLTWADSAYCYMMYKTLADQPGNGGIWNNAVHVVKVKENYTPELTYKIAIKHTSRNKIKVQAGVSKNPEDELPETVLGFPIFDFQGGNQFMQGGNTSDTNKTIEFGLDVTPLLGEIQSGETVKFFLQVIEDDPTNMGTGEIVNFSIMDYTDDFIEYHYPQSNIPINHDSITSLGLVLNLNFNQLFIETEELPVALVNEAYSKQLEVSGGSPPYKWNLVQHYNIVNGWGYFPQINGPELEMSDTIRGIAEQKIDFSFPYHGEFFDTLYIHTEGFIMFDKQTYPWPYLFDPNLMIRKTKILAPLLCRNFLTDSTNGDGIWYSGDENVAAFRWQLTNIKPDTSTVNFSMILYPTGNIEFYYGQNEIIPKEYWSSGISMGDDINYHYAEFENNSYQIGDNIQFTPEILPYEMKLDENGLFYGTPENYYNGIELEFVVTDYNNMLVRKVLQFYSWYAGTNESSDEKIRPLRIFPNPASDFITIEFELANDSFVTIEIIDQSGKKQKTLVRKNFNVGSHKLNWDLKTTSNQLLKDGIYYCSVKAENYAKTKKFIIFNRN